MERRGKEREKEKDTGNQQECWGRGSKEQIEV